MRTLKQSLSLILALSMLISMLVIMTVPTAAAETTVPDGLTPWSGAVDEAWYDDGAAGTYTITTPEQLAGLATLTNAGTTFEGKTVNLGADIDLGGSDTPWDTCIGTDTNRFNGTFDGNGYTVYRMYRSVSSGNRFIGGGLFGCTGDASVLQNISIDGAAYDITNGYRVNDHAFVVGIGYGAIINCTVTSSTITIAAHGQANTDYRNGNGTRCIGAICGRYAGTAGITGCTVDNVTVDVPTAHKDCVGGAGLTDFGFIFGYSENKTPFEIKNCTVINSSITKGDYSVSQFFDRIGGIAGGLNSGVSALFENCKAFNVDIEGGGCLGGILGGYFNSNNYTKFDGCVFIGSIKGENFVKEFKTNTDNKLNIGGIIGQTQADSGGVSIAVVNCTVMLDASVNSISADKMANIVSGGAFGINIGGVIGHLHTPQTTGISNNNITLRVSSVDSTALGDTTATVNIGGAIGICGNSRTIYFGNNLISIHAPEATYVGSAMGNHYGACTFKSHTNFYICDRELIAVGTDNLSCSITGISECTADTVAQLNTMHTDISGFKFNYSGWTYRDIVLEYSDWQMGNALTVDGASVTMSDDLAVNFYVDQAPTLHPVTVKINGTEATGTDGKYTLGGINASEMGKTVKLELAIDGVAAETVSYSILQYAINMYGKDTTSPEMKAVIEAMMHYGNAAEATKGDATLLAAFAAGAGYTAPETFITDGYAALGLTPRATVTPGVIDSAALVASGNVQVVINLTDKTATKATVTYGEVTKTYEVVDGQFTTDLLYATSLRRVFTVTVDGVSTDYSVSNYIVAAQTAEGVTEAQKTLAQAMAVYMNAINVYANTYLAN